MPTQNEENNNLTAELPKYFIDIDWHYRHKRTLSSLVRSRLSVLGEENLSEVPKNKSEKVIFSKLKKLKIRSGPFIPPDLPIKEAVFRIFLLAGNTPMDSEQVKDKLVKWWLDIGPYKDIESISLQRMMDSDSYYGFRQVKA